MIETLTEMLPLLNMGIAVAWAWSEYKTKLLLIDLVKRAKVDVEYDGGPIRPEGL